MAEILTQSQIDALIASLTSQETAQPVRASEPRRARRMRTYDFKRPDKFSKEQLRTLHVIHENFARLLTTFYTATFRTVVQIVVGSVDQTTYADFMRTVHNPSVIVPFNLPPLHGTCVLDINPVVAFPMVDRLFGGPGSALNQVRELTEIEKSVMMRVVRGTLAAFKEAWSQLAELSPEPVSLETNPIFVQVAAPSEIVAVVAVDVRVGEHVGVISLCLPHLTLEPILEKLSTHNWFGGLTRQVRSEDRDALRRQVEQTRVPVIAYLGHTKLTIRELLELEPGDLVVLNTRVGGEVEVAVGNQTLFRGRPGQVHGRLAVRITGVVEAGGTEDE